jgi:hypothetical protein
MIVGVAFLALSVALTGSGVYLWMFLAREQRSPLLLLIGVGFIFLGWCAFDHAMDAFYCKELRLNSLDNEITNWKEG